MGESEGFRKASTLSFFTTSQHHFDSPDSVMSPTSILDTKPFSNLRQQNSPRAHSVRKLDSRGICLGIADVIALSDDNKPDPNSPCPESPKVLFGSQLKIQIPPLIPSPFSPAKSPTTPVEFGIKTRKSQLRNGLEIVNPPRVVAASLSATEMEMSEDYTCVISHGPIPKTTHIFNNCIVESCCDVADWANSYPSQSFLSFCHTCKKQLELGTDIYMYRGEKAFCSGECRYKEMLLEERMEKSGE